MRRKGELMSVQLNLSCVKVQRFFNCVTFETLSKVKEQQRMLCFTHSHYPSRYTTLYFDESFLEIIFFLKPTGPSVAWLLSSSE